MTEEHTDQETNPQSRKTLARKTPATRVGDPSLYASVNDIAAQAIKSVFIANGGGVLVLLAFFWQCLECRWGSARADRGRIGAISCCLFGRCWICHPGQFHSLCLGTDVDQLSFQRSGTDPQNGSDHQCRSSHYWIAERHRFHRWRVVRSKRIPGVAVIEKFMQ